MEFADYRRGDAEVHDWNPSALEVFAFVRGRIQAELPNVRVEHIGSSSVPGMRGKGYLDVMVLPANLGEVSPAAAGLERLGLQHARGSRPSDRSSWVRCSAQRR